MRGFLRIKSSARARSFSDGDRSGSYVVVRKQRFGVRRGHVSESGERTSRELRLPLGFGRRRRQQQQQQQQQFGIVVGFEFFRRRKRRHGNDRASHVLRQGRSFGSGFLYAASSDR